jgi:hypothetical protein
MSGELLTVAMADALGCTPHAELRDLTTRFNAHLLAVTLMTGD